MDSRFGYADLPYGQVHYARLDRPDAPAGATILLNSRSRSFLPAMRLLKGTGTVLNVDIPGFGLSTPVPGSPSMRDIAAGVVGVLDALRIGRADFVGVHTGHKVATAVAQHRPDRVDRLVVVGRSHSLVPDHARRNAAMRAVVEENQLDMSIIRMEGRYADDTTSQRAFAAVFEANFAFDFAAALRGVTRPVMVVEIASEREDRLYGRQGADLVEGMADARVVTLTQTDPTGLLSYVGVEELARVVNGFLAAG